MSNDWLNDDDDIHYTEDGVFCRSCGRPWAHHLEALYQPPEPRKVIWRWNVTTGEMTKDDVYTQ